MTKEQLQSELDLLQADFDNKRKAVIVKYCDANNPYKVGDKFTDHCGTIVIEKVMYDLSEITRCCVFYGLELKKDGTPRKDGSKRKAWQTNELKNNNK